VADSVYAGVRFGLVDLDVPISGFWFVRRYTQNDYGAVCSLATACCIAVVKASGCYNLNIGTAQVRQTQGRLLE